MPKIAKYSLFAAFWLFSVMLSASIGRPAAHSEASVSDTLYAKSLVLVSETGEPSIVLTNRDNGPKVFLYSKSGHPLISMGITEPEKSLNDQSSERSAGIFIHTENGEPLVSMTLVGDTATITATNPGMHSNASMIVDKDYARLGVDNNDGKSIVAINLAKRRPGITIFDAEKKINWKTPLEPMQ